MYQNEINTLLNSFCISEEELKQRVLLNEFIHSLSSLLIDDFATNYLLNNPYLSIYLAHTDGNMLLKKIKNFVAFLFTAPVDEEYVKKVHAIGTIHYSIKLDPAKVSYGFWAINEVLDKISKTNALVQEHKSFISKFFKFVEHLMNNGYYLAKDKEQKDLDTTSVKINTQNELYVAFNLHKLNAQKVTLAVSDSTKLHLLDEIKECSSQCAFGKILRKIESNTDYEYILGVSSEKIHDIHDRWHKEFVAIKNALKNNKTQELHLHNTNIEFLSKQLSTILDASLQDALEDGQIALLSGMRSMKSMTQLFYKKDYKNIQKNTITNIIESAVNETIYSEFSWAIDTIEILTDRCKLQADNLITKFIRYESTNLIISIELQEDYNTSYINEILHLLLEALELHFYVQDRELSLIKFADEAEGANKSKDIFLANMSHELRTPINAITGFSQILMMKKETPDSIKKYIEKINIAGNNLLELVNTILDFAKLESGKMQFNPALSNVSDLLTEVKTLITPMANKKNIELVMPNVVSLNLYIDKTLFKQVLINLLTNAIKFSHDKGKVCVIITYVENKRAYSFEVKDTGVGLSQEEVKKLFHPFSQVDNVYQKEHKGSGLGLMISKTIIEELHHGKIWVESKKEVGSSFFIQMPTPIVEANTYTISNAPDDAYKILIVEDSEEYQKILTLNLEATHNLTITNTVNKAKDLVSANHYDYLILDFFLTDGISSEVLHYMESENISIPSIVISAEDEIHIASSLAGSTNLQCIINKKDIYKICASIRGEIVLD